MIDRIEKLERQVADLALEVAALRAAIRDGTPAPDSASAVTTPTVPDTSAEKAPEGWAISRDFERLVAEHGLVILAGIACIVLAVAVVLRQATITTALPVAVGAGLGLLYCSLLAAVSFFRYRKGAAVQGDVFLVLAIAILHAILVEVTLRPDGFARGTSYAVLTTALVTLGFLSLRNGRAIPFTASILAAPIAAAAIGGKPFHHPLFAVVLGTSLLMAWIGSILRGYGRARWFLGVLTLCYVLTLGVLGKSALNPEMTQHALARPVPALAVLAGLLVILILPAIVASWKRGRSLDAFEVTTTVAGPLCGLIAGAGILMALPSGARIAGLSCLAMGGISYATAGVAFVRHGAESRSFYVLSINALVYVLVGAYFLTDGGVVYGTVVQGVALALAIFGLKLGKRTLTVQAFLLTILAFLVNAGGAMALGAPGAELPARVGPALWLIASGAMAISVFVIQRAFRWDHQGFSLRRLHVHATALVAALGIGLTELLSGLLPLCYLLALRLFSRGDLEFEADLWHTIFTLLLVSGSLVTLGLGVRLRLGGATILAVGVMAAAGLKLFLHDAMRVHWTLLAFSAGAFGLSLISASVIYSRVRGIRRSEETGQSPDSPAEEASSLRPKNGNVLSN